jgi:hypothetical protein
VRGGASRTAGFGSSFYQNRHAVKITKIDIPKSTKPVNSHNLNTPKKADTFQLLRPLFPGHTTQTHTQAHAPSYPSSRRNAGLKDKPSFPELLLTPTPKFARKNWEIWRGSVCARAGWKSGVGKSGACVHARQPPARWDRTCGAEAPWAGAHGHHGDWRVCSSFHSRTVIRHNAATGRPEGPERQLWHV